MAATPAAASLAEPVGHGVYAVDGAYIREGIAAIHIVQAGSAFYVVDTGTFVSVPRVLTALDGLGIARSSVSHVILTHIHLDHAGGAGALMQALPEACLVVHPRGARHMADPSRLVAGSMAVYGETAFRDLFGEIVPIDADRIIETVDNDEIRVGDRVLRFLHTPGHAKHHHCIVDDVAGGVFTGDSFGIAYRSLHTPQGPFIFPTTTPVDFDPDHAHESIERIVATGHNTAWLGHYSRVDDLAALAPQLHHDLDVFVELAAPGRSAEAVEADLFAHLNARAEAMGHLGSREDRRHAFALDARLNAQGLVYWRSRQTR